MAEGGKRVGRGWEEGGKRGVGGMKELRCLNDWMIECWCTISVFVESNIYSWMRIDEKSCKIIFVIPLSVLYMVKRDILVLLL
jgi:hypothetical protein